MLRLLLLPLICCFLFTSANPSQGILEVTIDNVQSDMGRIWVGVYESESDFLDREKARLVAAAVDKAGKITIVIDALDYGEDYAFAIFHDENDNGEMDRNWLGIPTEPWAFSGEPRTRLRLPRFGEVNFTFKPQQEKQVVSLRKL